MRLRDITGPPEYEVEQQTLRNLFLGRANELQLGAPLS